jgi:hypothetical protein
VSDRYDRHLNPNGACPDVAECDQIFHNSPKDGPGLGEVCPCCGVTVEPNEDEMMWINAANDMPDLADRFPDGVNESLTPGMLASLKKETLVAFPMSAWDELEYLVDDSDPTPTDLPSVIVLAWKAKHGRLPTGDEVTCEGEEAGNSWEFYVQGIELTELLRIVRSAVPEGWTADIVAVSGSSLQGTQINITRA